MAANDARPNNSKGQPRRLVLSQVGRACFGLTSQATPHEATASKTTRSDVKTWIEPIEKEPVTRKGLEQAKPKTDVYEHGPVGRDKARERDDGHRHEGEHQTPCPRNGQDRAEGDVCRHQNPDGSELDGCKSEEVTPHEPRLEEIGVARAVSVYDHPEHTRLRQGQLS